MLKYTKYHTDCFYPWYIKMHLQIIWLINQLAMQCYSICTKYLMFSHHIRAAAVVTFYFWAGCGSFLWCAGEFAVAVVFSAFSQFSSLHSFPSEVPGNPWSFSCYLIYSSKYSTVCRHITADIKNTTCVTDISRCVFLLLLYGLLEYFDPVYFPWELYGSRCAENLLEMMRTLLLMDENLIFPELFSQVWTFLWLIEFASQYFVCQYSMWEFNGESWNLLPQLIVPLFQVS